MNLPPYAYSEKSGANGAGFVSVHLEPHDDIETDPGHDVSHTVLVQKGYTQLHAIVLKIVSGIQQTVAFAGFSYTVSDKEYSTSACSFSDDCTDSTVHRFAVRGVLLFRRVSLLTLRTIQLWTAVASTVLALPAQTLRIISRLVCLAIRNLPSRRILGLSWTSRGFRCSSRETRGSVPCHAGTTSDNAYRPSKIWTGFFKSWSSDIFTEEKVDIHVQIHQGGRLMEVPGDCSTETFFAKARRRSWPT